MTKPALFKTKCYPDKLEAAQESLKLKDEGFKIKHIKKELFNGYYCWVIYYS